MIYIFLSNGRISSWNPASKILRCLVKVTFQPLYFSKSDAGHNSRRNERGPYADRQENQTQCCVEPLKVKTYILFLTFQTNTCFLCPLFMVHGKVKPWKEEVKRKQFITDFAILAAVLSNSSFSFSYNELASFARIHTLQFNIIFYFHTSVLGVSAWLKANPPPVNC